MRLLCCSVYDIAARNFYPVAARVDALLTLLLL